MAARESEQRWREVEVEGFRVLVGRTAADNDHLTFRVARPKDLWLHAAGCPGSHVVIALPDDADGAPARVVERAAELAAYYSKARDATGKVPVHLCRASDVRKERGAPAGEVRLRRYRSVKAYPRGI